MGVLTYSFENTSCLLAGVPLEGFSDSDSAIKISYDEDHVSLRVGNDGAAVRSISANKSATIELEVLEGSMADMELGALYLIDRSTGAGAVPWAFSDPASGSSHATESIWIQKPPESSYGGPAGVKLWTLRTHKLNSVFSPLAPIRAI